MENYEIAAYLFYLSELYRLDKKNKFIGKSLFGASRTILYYPKSIFNENLDSLELPFVGTDIRRIIKDIKSSKIKIEKIKV